MTVRLNYTINPESPANNQPTSNTPQPVIPDQSKLQNFVDRLLRRNPQPEERSFIITSSTEDVVGDLSWIIRAFMDPPVMPDSFAVEAMGVTTAENLFQGAWAATLAYRRAIRAQGIGDRDGMIEGRLDTARGVAQSLAGLTILGYRCTQGAADILKVNTGMNATTVLGRATFALGMLGNALYGLFFTMLGLWGAWGLYKDTEFSSGLNAVGDDPVEQLKFLKKKAMINSKEPLQGLGDNPEKKATLKLEATREALSQFIELLKEEGILGTLSEEDAKAVIGRIFDEMNESSVSRVKQKYANALGLTLDEVKDLSVLELIGFVLLEGNRQRKLDAQLGRVSKGECVQAIKNAVARGLEARLQAEDPLVKAAAKREFDEIKGKITFENNKQKIIHAALLIIGVVGLISTAAGFIAFPPGWVVILLAVSTAIVAIGCLGVDTYFMTDSWNNGMRPGRNDMRYHAVIAGILVTAFIIGLIVTLHFGLPLLPLILAGVIALSGSMVCIGSCYKIWQKEKKWIEDHPDLETFKTKLISSHVNCDETIMKLFKKLPKADRLAIRQKMTEEGAWQALGLAFKQHEYLNLDRGNFGENYLTHLTEQMANVDGFNKAYSLIERAIKKTAKSLWAEDGSGAMEMQGLLETMRTSKEAVEQARGVNEEDRRITAFNRAINTFKRSFDAIKTNHERYLKLKQNIWYIAKRQDSQQDLINVIASVATDRTAQQGAVIGDRQKTADVFNHFQSARSMSAA